MQAMIDINHLRVTKGGRTICSVPELDVARGERVALLGPNGSGKTTLLRVLAGLETDYEGECNVEATPKRRVYVHQSPYMFRGTVLANVAYGLRANGIRRSESRQSVLDWLERLGLQDLADQRAARLSGGEQRRVALARAMILQPQLLLLDEPLADMDEAGAIAVAAALDKLPESTILVASPSPLPHGLTSREHTLKPNVAEPS